MALSIGDVKLRPEINEGYLCSLGAIQIGDTALRNPATRFLPWFDSYEGDIFRRFAFLGSEQRDDVTVLNTRAVSDPDMLFRERRDCSGDPCFRNVSWDTAPLEADLRICLKPAQCEIGQRHFTGFQYWFEYESANVPIHRLVDRQTWEVGGNLDDITICLRNWLTPPRMRIARGTTYSTVGLDKWAGLLPGNLWGRWTLLPSFDMQYGNDGILLGWFDQVSLIRTVIESNAGEDCLRCLDMHLFEQATTVQTNPKTILWSPDEMDEVDALNLWTRIYDREREKAASQFNIKHEEPPAIVFAENVWTNYRFDSTYDHMVDVAAEFDADYVFIDVIWEQAQALHETINALMPEEQQKGTILEKLRHDCMCAVLDFQVADIHGGEAGLKRLCDKAREKGMKVISWMAAHLSPNSAVQYNAELGHGGLSIFAAKESGRHPDTGYAMSCWPANLNAPIGEYIKTQILGVCARTGLSGFLWDSFCNMGWWQIDYSDGTMRPQYDKMAEMYADLTNAGLYIMPEAIVTFSNHSCCGLHGGNVYAGDLLGYSYNTNLGLESAEWSDGVVDSDLRNYEERLITGQESIDMFFRCIAHKRIPSLHFHGIPRESWHAERVGEIKEVLALYKQHRSSMRTRTVLKDNAGVLWEDEVGNAILFSFKAQPYAGKAVDAATGEHIQDGKLKAYRAYRIIDPLLVV